MIKIFVTFEDDLIHVMCRGEDEHAVGDLHLQVLPGETLCGQPYEYFRDLGEGEHSVDL